MFVRLSTLVSPMVRVRLLAGNEHDAGGHPQQILALLDTVRYDAGDRSQSSQALNGRMFNTTRQCPVLPISLLHLQLCTGPSLTSAAVDRNSKETHMCTVMSKISIDPV